MAKYDMNNLKKYKIGIIGGSGIYDFAELDRKKTIEAKDGPFGMPSGNIQYGILNGVEIYFIPRHGKNHTLSPSDIPYRANIDFLKRLGCNDLVSVSAVGSLKEEFSPGTFILVDQFITNLKNKKLSSSFIFSNDDQKYLMNEIEVVNVHKGNLKDSDICFIKRQIK